MSVGKRDAGRALQNVLGRGGNVNAGNPLEVHDPKVGSLISYEGTTTADGAGDGSSLIDNVLTTKPDYDGNLVIITSGAYAGQARDINGITTGGTVSPHLAFDGQILRGTKFVIAAIRLTPAEVAALVALVNAIEVKAERIDFGGVIYFDHLRGVAGTAYPIGTPLVPSNNITDVITLCTARLIKVIDVWGILNLNADREGYTFIGHRTEDPAIAFDLGGQSLDGSVIRGCTVKGTQGGVGFLTLEDCIIYQLVDFQGIANLCDLYGSAMTLRNLGFQDLSKCNSVHSDLTITVNAPTRASFKECAGNCTFTGQTGGDLYIRGYKGTLVIDTMTDGVCDIYANGADITINVSCAGTGVIKIYGNARVTDNHGAGTIVNDYTKETQLDAMQGAGWTDETLKAIKDAIDAVIPGVGDATQAKQDAIEAKLDLPAADETANTLIGEVIGQKGDVANETASQASIIGLLRAIITTYLNDGTIGLSNLQTLLAAIPTVMVGTNDAALASVLGALDTAAAEGAVTNADEAMAYIKQLVTLLLNAGYGLDALQTLLAAITAAGPTKAEMDAAHALLATPAQVVTALTTYDAPTKDEMDTAHALLATLAKQNRVLCSMDFWSIPQTAVVVPAGAAPQTLPDVVVDLPAGVTVVKATAMFKFRMLANAGAANKLAGDQFIQIQKAAGAFANAISLVADQFGIAEATREGGDIVIGDLNVVATVDGNETYGFQWTDALADIAGLTFNDLQMGIRVFYSL